MSSTSTTSHNPTASPSSLSLSSLNWNFEPVSNPITCTNVNISWTFFNSQSDIDTIFASTSTVDFNIAISGFGSSNVSIPLKYEGSAERVLGGSKSVFWFANIPPGFYIVNGVVTANVSGSQSANNTSPSIETSFRLLQGANTSCISSKSTSSLSPSVTTATQAQSHPPANIGAIAGGVGGALVFALLTTSLVFFLRRHQRRRHLRHGSTFSNERDARNGTGWSGLASDGFLNSSHTALDRNDPSVLTSNQGPDSSNILEDSGQSRNNLLTENNGSVSTAEFSAGSTEAVLHNSYVTTSFQIPRLPVADFLEKKVQDGPQPLLSAARDDHTIPSDIVNSSIRPLPSPVAPVLQEDLAAEILETSGIQVSGSRNITFPYKRHADSGVRLGRETLLYDVTNSEWSLRSKDRLPPLYTHN